MARPAYRDDLLFEGFSARSADLLFLNFLDVYAKVPNPVGVAATGRKRYPKLSGSWKFLTFVNDDLNSKGLGNHQIHFRDWAIT